MDKSIENYIIVLMSTYNGEKYLEEQMNSLFSQKDVNFSILVRDDGSTDKTKLMLEKWSVEGNIKWYAGYNIGPAKSFLDLINKAPDADYYAFCDQDDVWDEDKLKIAINHLSSLKTKQPSLYHCLPGRVDKNLNQIDTHPMETLNTFGFALVTSPTGCTVMFNKTLQKLAKEYIPDVCTMHDLWLYRICAAVGGILIYDSVSHIKYRLHGGNVDGKNRNLVEKVIYWLTYNDHSSSETAKEIIKGYSDKMSPRNLEIITALANYRHNYRTTLKLMFNREFCVPGLTKNLLLKYLILMGKL